MDQVLLEECCEILDSKRVPITASDRKEGPYPYYGANGIQDHVDDYIFDDELVLLAEDGGNFGSKERPIAYRVSGKCWVNNHAHVLKPKDGMDVDYLCYSLMFYDTEKLVNGATRQKLTQAMMRKMLIPKRSMSEQKKIVATLNTMRDSMVKQTKRIELLSDLIKARFVEMFEECEKIKLSDFATITMGQSPTSDSYNDSGDGLPFFQGKADYGDKYTVVRHYTNKPTKVVEYGTVLMSVRAPVGPVNIASDKCCLGRGLCGIVAKPGVSNNEFLFNAIKAMKNEISQKGTGSTFKAISKNDVLDIELPKATMQEQKQFATFVAQVDKSKFALSNELAMGNFYVRLIHDRIVHGRVDL